MAVALSYLFTNGTTKAQRSRTTRPMGGAETAIQMPPSLCLQRSAFPLLCGMTVSLLFLSAQSEMNTLVWGY